MTGSLNSSSKRMSKVCAFKMDQRQQFAFFIITKGRSGAQLANHLLLTSFINVFTVLELLP